MIKKLIYGLSLIVLSTVGLTGCLEDKGYTDIVNGVGAEPVVSFFGNQGGGVVSKAAKAGTPTSVTLTVNVGSPSVLDRDIVMKIGTDQATLTNYNTAKKTTYVLLPASAYAPTDITATVPAGKRDADFVVSINVPASLDVTPKYAIPLLIKDAAGVKVSSNLGYTIVAVTVSK